MKKLPLKKYIFFISVIFAGIGIDQLTKWLAVRFIMPKGTIPIIEGALHLTYAENKGAAFSMLSDSRWVFMSISTVAIIALSVFLFSGRVSSRLYEVSISMIISGGIGNMIDRIALGYVVDFIDFRLIDFAIFNGADSFVCVGAGMLILALVLDIIKESKLQKEKKNDK